MRKAFAVLILLLVAALLPAYSKPIDSLNWEQGMTSINSGWRTHPGDQTAWAAPDFDDSSWQLTTLGESHPPTPGKFDERWYRLRIELPVSHPPLALLVSGFDNAWEIYVNGRRVPGAALASAWGVFWFPNGSSALPIDGSGPTLIALRTRVPNTSVFFADHSAFGVSLGTRDVIEYAAGSEQGEKLRHAVISIGIHIMMVFAAFSLILLSRFQRDHPEYLWIGLNLLFLSFLLLGGLAQGGFLPASIMILVAVPSLYLATVAQIEFTFTFASRPVTRLWRSYEAVILLAGLLLPPLVWTGNLGFFPYTPIEAAFILPASIILPVLLLVWYRRGNREAGWLILPSLLPLLSSFMLDLGIIGAFVGSKRLSTLVDQIHIGPLVFAFEDLAHLLYLMAIGTVVYLRFIRVSQQQARSAAELAAARTVQQVLVPAENPAIPGFVIEAVYHPASEVGGDFYQIVPTSQGGVLACVGDVSGKGMPAAMTVSLLVGTFRTLAHYTQSPGEILHAMNQRMLARSQGGFTTCLVLRVDADGILTAANAGHIPPYLNGKELATDSGLPLGLSPESIYGENACRLDHGARLTLLTDGVVEARNQDGELFGFERAATLSPEPAQEIAQAAQAFGQEDDITVLTLSFAPVEVLGLPSLT